MVNGVVKWFSEDKGFGFVSDDNQEDFFIHHSNIAMDGFRNLQKGDEVIFDVEKSDKGLNAVNLKLRE